MPRPRTAPTKTRDAGASRARVFAAAAEEFAARGFDGAKVDRIAERAGVNKRLIYYYFGSKEGLYLAVLEQAYGDIRAIEQTSIYRTSHRWRRSGAWWSSPSTTRTRIRTSSALSASRTSTMGSSWRHRRRSAP